MNSRIDVYRAGELFSWRGEIERGPYFLLGAVLFVLKFNIDRLVSTQGFHRSWSILDYQDAGRLLWQAWPTQTDSVYFATLLAVSLPFLVVGVNLTLKRLRSAGLGPWWVIMFFVPIVKLLFFAALCVLPPREVREERVSQTGDIRGWLGLLIPRHPTGSAVLGVAFSLAYSVAAVYVAANWFQSYAWTLFAGVPFCMGFFPVLIFSYHQRRTWQSCMATAMLTLAIAGAALLVLAFEGLICLIMAAPIAVVIALIGAGLAYKIQAAEWWNPEAPRLLCSVLLAVSVAQGIEPGSLPEAPLLQVRTAIDVNAPPALVWKHVVSFSDLPSPKEWIFRLGIAYPVRAQMFGAGPNAVRHCQFSTGPFVEPIQVWEAPRLLRFKVIANPAPMEEWTPYRKIHPPHLKGFLESQRGQFRLVELPNNRTRLEGTTWYRHHMWPVTYWQVWSDYIIHKIHGRVLAHIKVLAESDPALGAAGTGSAGIPAGESS